APPGDAAVLGVARGFAATTAAGTGRQRDCRQGTHARHGSTAPHVLALCHLVLLQVIASLRLSRGTRAAGKFRDLSYAITNVICIFAMLDWRSQQVKTMF